MLEKALLSNRHLPPGEQRGAFEEIQEFLLVYERRGDKSPLASKQTEKTTFPTALLRHPQGDSPITEQELGSIRNS